MRNKNKTKSVERRQKATSEYPRALWLRFHRVLPRQNRRALLSRAAAALGSGRSTAAVSSSPGGEGAPSSRVPACLAAASPHAAVSVLAAARGRLRPDPAARGGRTGRRPPGGRWRLAGTNSSQSRPPESVFPETGSGGRPAALRRLASCPTDLGLPGSTLPHAAARSPVLAGGVLFQPPPALYRRVTHAVGTPTEGRPQTHRQPARSCCSVRGCLSPPVHKGGRGSQKEGRELPAGG